MAYVTNKIEAWTVEAERRGEKLVVVIKNKTTGEEVETGLNPLFVASCTAESAFSRPELQYP